MKQQIQSPEDWVTKWIGHLPDEAIQDFEMVIELMREDARYAAMEQSEWDHMT